MVERQVQSVGDYFQEKVDNLIHQMHSCKLGEQVKLVFVCFVDSLKFTINFVSGNACRDHVETSRSCL